MWKTQQGRNAVVINRVRFTLYHPMHFPNIVLPYSIELGYHFSISVMLDLHDFINRCPLTRCNDNQEKAYNSFKHASNQFTDSESMNTWSESWYSNSSDTECENL
jgi:hypothetical protein